MNTTLPLPISLAIGLACILFGAFCGWRGAQPVNPIKGPRMIPWRFLMVVSAFGFVLMLWQVGKHFNLARPPGM